MQRRFDIGDRPFWIDWAVNRLEGQGFERESARQAIIERHRVLWRVVEVGPYDGGLYGSRPGGIALLPLTARGLPCPPYTVEDAVSPPP